MYKMYINMYELLTSISNALDLSVPRLATHHERVAYLSYTLAKEMGLSFQDQKEIYVASIVHDFGALSVDERIELVDSDKVNMNHHAFVGGNLIKTFAPLENVAKIVKYHHIPWNYGQGVEYEGEEVPYLSHIINFTDAICNLIDPDTNILSQANGIIEKVEEKKGSVYDPELFDVFNGLAKKESLWLNLTSKSPVSNIYNIQSLLVYPLEIDDLINLTHLFSYLIDFRSEFTSVHSAGVAIVAKELASIAGFSPYECKMMLVAGYLHDLGKLAIDPAILDKPGKLSQEEIYIMRSHTYYTYQLLKPILGLQTINNWASFHHEKLNGKGYPFRLDKDRLSIGSRIMVVADIFSAITEDRPYRKGMTKDQTSKVLNNLVKDGSIDGVIVGLALDNYEGLTRIRKEAQDEAEVKYTQYKDYKE